MNIEEMTKNLKELVDDPEKASVIFKVILKSGNPDIIQRAVELYVLLILNHAEDIEKAFDAEHDREESNEQRIRHLERQLDDYRKDCDNSNRKDRDNWPIIKKDVIWKEPKYKWESYLDSSPDLKDYTYLESIIKDLK